MRYAGIIKNDFAAAPGVCLSFFVQGCPIHCKGCHNPESWDFEGGKEFTPEVIDEVIKGLTANGIHRTLCIMGGEPMCDGNLFLTDMIVREVKAKLPNTKIWIWTGYEAEEIFNRRDPRTLHLIQTVNGFVTGPYVEALRDITLPMRGSSNQQIIELSD